MRAWHTPSVWRDDDSFWKCNNLRGCLILLLSAAKCSETRGCLCLQFFSLILGKWNVNGQKGKWIEARVALFFLRLLVCDQQTKWVREGFHNISGEFPHRPRWETRIFLMQNNFNFPQFVRAGDWSFHTFFFYSNPKVRYVACARDGLRAPAGPFCKPGTFLQAWDISAASWPFPRLYTVP